MKPRRLKNTTLTKRARHLVFFTTLLTKLFRNNCGHNEYSGSNVKFNELQFNLFVAGELEIISNKKIDEIEKNM